MLRESLFSAFFFTAIVVGAPAAIAETDHPNLTLTASDVTEIRSRISEVPRAMAQLDAQRAKLEEALTRGVDIPVPKDAGGGYTHEQHKRNYQTMLNAGLMFQITKESKYLNLARSMLLEYAELYPSLDIHPKPKEQTPGKLFWQSLNEAVWLVHTIQAYDLVASALSDSEKNQIEENLLRPVANYLSHGQPKTFNKIHNHGTWAVAAVGMTGYVLNDEKLVRQALYDLDEAGKGGFLKQIEQLFSPDGYYAEGPYYQRYALMPFVLFAKAIQVNQPELEIFEYRDKTLLKAIETSIQLSYNGLFFGINDAIKDKGIDTIELVHAVAIAYELTKDPSFLSIALRQNQTLLTGYGFALAQALEENLAEPFDYKSLLLRDGHKGDQGALAIFRNGDEVGHQAAVMKNTSQGLGHGHYDKLHWLFFDNGNEIVSDYGAARFLNIEAKYGGHYLPENNAFAKQTIAHNTVVVDEESHFYGDFKTAQASFPKVHFFAENEQIQITSASIDDAYEDVGLRRTIAMMRAETLEYPLMLDVFEVSSDASHQYDLPLYYQGQVISQSPAIAPDQVSLRPLGKKNGFQYLWNRGAAKTASTPARLTWLNDGRFYTYTTHSGNSEEVIFAQIGANDPNFNLRNENAFIQRIENKKNHIFVSLLETHGEYNGTAEYTVGAESQVTNIELVEDEDSTLVEISLRSGEQLRLTLAADDSANKRHQIMQGQTTAEWLGPYDYQRWFN